MAAPVPSRRATSLAVAVSGAVLAALGCLAVAPASGAATSSTFENCSGKIKIDGRQGKASFPKGGAATTTLSDVTITGCDMEIRANKASSPDFSVANSSWTLDGNVRIKAIQQGSRINADQAVVKFVDSEVQLITITGTPAEFEQQRSDSDQVTRGHAGKMIYEAGPGIVRLVDNAWLSDGSGKTLESPALWYDIRKAEMGYSSDKGKTTNSASGVTSSSDGDRVVITIDPKASKNAKKKDEGKAPASPPPDANGSSSPSPKP
jgi:lipopolysaccharide export system protein LptA